MVVRAILGLAFVLIGMGLARTPFQFFLLRLMQGALGGVVSAGVAFASSQAPDESRGAILGKLESAVAAGSLVGPLLGGLLINAWSFRTVLLLLGVGLGLWSVLAGMVLREEKLAGGSTTSSANMLTPFWTLIRQPATRNMLVAGSLANLGAYGLVAVFAVRVRDLVPNGHSAATWVGLLQAATWAAAALGAPWWGKRHDRSHPKRNFTLAALFCGVVVALQGAPISPYWLFGWRLVQGAAFAALIPAVTLVVVRASPVGEHGAYLGAANSLLVTGQIGGALFSALIGGWLSPGWTFAALGACFWTGALLATLPAAPLLTTRKGTVQS
jgi:MFS family permease